MVKPGNTKGGSITVPLTSCLTGLESAVWLLTIFVFISKTDESKPVKQEVNSIVILPPLVFPGQTLAYYKKLVNYGQKSFIVKVLYVAWVSWLGFTMIIILSRASVDLGPILQNFFRNFLQFFSAIFWIWTLDQETLTEGQ
jgi:hypothetical protein